MKNVRKSIRYCIGKIVTLNEDISVVMIIIIYICVVECSKFKIKIEHPNILQSTIG